MRKTILALLAVALIAPAAAQVPNTLPANTVVGRLGIGSGPAQAIPFATFIAQNNLLQNSSGSVTVIVDHTSGVDQAGCGTAAGNSACNTILFAYQQLQTTGRVGRGGLATIQSDCNFTETPGAAFLGPSGTGGAGGGVVFIKGNEALPSACSWTSNGIVVDDGAVISLRGFKTINATSGKTWLTVTKMGLAVFANMQWSTAASGAHVAIGEGGVFVYDGGTYQVGDSGCAPGCFNYHVINNGGYFEMFGATVSVPSVLTFTAWYNGVGSGSSTNFGVNTFSGAGSGAGSTGTQYILGKNATIPLYSGELTFPGATAGTIATGACVDNTCAPIAAAQAPQCVPNVQVFTSGTNATYTTPTCTIAGVATLPLYIEWELIGAGGGGAGSGTTPGAASAGGNTCVNTSGAACTSPVFAANGGAIGSTSFAVSTGGAPNSCDGNSYSGGQGGPGTGQSNAFGGYGGGTTASSGGPPGGAGGAAGAVPPVNTGGGGGGASDGATVNSGGGGAGGATCRKQLSSPAASYVYTVGVHGNGGTAGTSGFAGGNGADGIVTARARWM